MELCTLPTEVAEEVMEKTEKRRYMDVICPAANLILNSLKAGVLRMP